MDACEEVDVDIHAFLTSALDGGEWLASHPHCFTSKERAPPYPVNRRLGVPQSPSEHSEEEALAPVGN